MSKEEKNKGHVAGPNTSTFNRRAVLLGSSSLVVATALTSEAMAQAHRTKPVSVKRGCRRQEAEHSVHHGRRHRVVQY
jgi:hypothetical protein